MGHDRVAVVSETGSSNKKNVLSGCVGISTACGYGFSIEETLEMINEAGFHYVEWGIVEHTLDVDIPTMQKLLKQFDLQAISIHVPFSYLYRVGWEDFGCSVRRSLDLARSSGCHYLVTHPPLRESDVSLEHYDKETLEYFEQMQQWQRDIEDIVVSAENLNTWYYADVKVASNSLGLFLKILKEKNIPLTLDISHLAMGRYDIPRIVHEARTLIRQVHLSDFRDDIEHLPLGYGTLPYEELLQRFDPSWNIVLEFDFCTPERRAALGNPGKKDLKVLLARQKEILRNNGKKV